MDAFFTEGFLAHEVVFGMRLGEILAILGMASATYSTRVLGWLFLKNKHLCPRTTAILEAAPACVMVSITAPFFFTANPANLAALAVAVVVARKKGLAETVAASVLTCAGIRWLFAMMG